MLCSTKLVQHPMVRSSYKMIISLCPKIGQDRLALELLLASA